MTPERAAEFQERITKEAIALMVIHGKSVCTAASETGVSVAHYEEAVSLIGKAWNLPAEMTTENLVLIQQERYDLMHSTNAAHVFPEEELPMNATGMETLDNVWDLFETAVQMDIREQRTALFKLANELAECQNLLDWIMKTPVERELPEIAAG